MPLKSMKGWYVNEKHILNQSQPRKQTRNLPMKLIKLIVSFFFIFFFRKMQSIVIFATTTKKVF